MALTKITNSAIADDIGLGGNPTTSTQTAGNSTTRIATTAFVSTAVANLVDSAPATLNTLNELAAAIGDNATFSSTMTTSIASKLPLAGGTLTGHLNLGDNVIAKFGLDADLQIYHSGSKSYIKDTGTGNLAILTSTLELNNAADSQNMIVANEGGAVTLFHSGSAKLASSSGGVTVTGNIGVTGTVDGIDIAARDAVLTSTTTTAGAALPKAGGTMTGNLIIDTSAAGAAVLGLERTGAANQWKIAQGHTATDYLEILEGSNVRLTIKNGGNVGIGTDSPDGKFVVSNGGAEGFEVFPGSASGQNSFQHYNRSGSAYLRNRNIASEFTFNLSGATDDAVTFKAGGNVGIGTTAPSNLLSLKGLGNNWNTSPAMKLWDSQYSKGWYVGTANNQAAGDYYIRSVTSESAYPVSADQQFTITQGGNVGIGTIAPNSRLHVKSSGTGNVLYVESSDGHHLGGFYQESDTRAAFNVRDASGSVKVNLDSGGNSWLNGGNVGIGNTNPNLPLTVTSNSGANAIAIRARSADDYGFIQFYNHAGTVLRGQIFNHNGAMAISTDTTGTARLYIDTSGNLSTGPGTQTGNGDGNITIREGNAFAGLDFKSARTAGNIGGPRFYNTSSDSVPKAQLLIEIDGSYNFYNGTNGAQNRLKIDSSGNVGIGTSNPYGKLQIEGATTNWASAPVLVFASTSTADARIRDWAIGPADSTYGNFHILQGASTGASPLSTASARLTISAAGNVGIGTDAPGHLLDILKSGSGDATVNIKSTTGGDPTLIFNSAAANRQGIIKFQDNGADVGRIDYVHSADRIDIQAGSASGATMSIKNGKVGIGTISPETTIDLEGALLMRANTANIGLGTFTAGSGMTPVSGGELQFMHMWSGVMAANDTIVFTYAATSWKSFWFEITASSTSGYGHSHIGGYSNNSLGYSQLETISTSMWTLTASNNGQALTFTVTLNANWIHPLIKINFGCGGGEGAPKLDRCSLVITS